MDYISHMLQNIQHPGMQTIIVGFLSDCKRNQAHHKLMLKSSCAGDMDYTSRRSVEHKHRCWMVRLKGYRIRIRDQELRQRFPTSCKSQDGAKASLHIEKFVSWHRKHYKPSDWSMSKRVANYHNHEPNNSKWYLNRTEFHWYHSIAGVQAIQSVPLKRKPISFHLEIFKPDCNSFPVDAIDLSISCTESGISVPNPRNTCIEISNSCVIHILATWEIPNHEMELMWQYKVGKCLMRNFLRVCWRPVPSSAKLESLSRDIMKEYSILHLLLAQSLESQLAAAECHCEPPEVLPTCRGLQSESMNENEPITVSPGLLRVDNSESIREML
ncbi:hypothetical protein VNO77_27379 [Canavalia gladiata]|uniref:Uncharacterized protein n=1 Tax=Canavalia gladiata TaxID=3824 RepID=A0AAN9KTX3_CANGL